MSVLVEFYKGASVSFELCSSEDGYLQLKYGRLVHFTLMYLFDSAAISVGRSCDVDVYALGVGEIVRLVKHEYGHLSVVAETIEAPLDHCEDQFFYLLLCIEEQVRESPFVGKLHLTALFGSFMRRDAVDDKDSALSAMLAMPCSLCKELLWLMCSFVDSDKIIRAGLPSDHEIDLRKLYEFI